MFCLNEPRITDSAEWQSLAEKPLEFKEQKAIPAMRISLDQHQQVAADAELMERLKDVKAAISDAKVDWYIVPSEDEHQSEFVADSEKRREYITGFTGSAGVAVIPREGISSKAVLMVDSRYWIQAEQQAPKEGWEIRRLSSSGGKGGPGIVVNGWMEFIINEVEDGGRVGIDPKLVPLSVVKLIQSSLDERDSSTKLIPLETNLIDRSRTSAPARSLAPVIPHPMKFSGESTPSKLARIRSTLSSKITKGEWIYLLPVLPSIAWLINIRSLDIPYTPVAYAYLALTKDDCVLFVDKRKVENEDLQGILKEDGVIVKEYGIKEIGKYVEEQVSLMNIKGEDGKKQKVKIWAPRECSWALSKAVEPALIEYITCPVELAKAIKNPIEQQGFRNAYLRDGRATVRWMAWLEDYLIKQKKEVGEWAAVQTLTRFRREEENFAGLAYKDISASGPNAALPHYMPDRGKDRIVDLETPYLIDSGAQYYDGTIDTTRTFFFGTNPTPEMKRAYTRVLQGHMAVFRTQFPKGMNSTWLNMLAKQPLYLDKLDYSTGLGHGVGSYLTVHEFPSSFPSGFSFEPGHVTTVEPGVYKEGEFGIRIESLALCKEVEEESEEPPKSEAKKSNNWLTWENITQVPIPNNMVEWSIMTKPEIQWLNDHNTSVENALMPLLQEDRDASARDWLKRNCKPHRIWPWTGAH